MKLDEVLSEAKTKCLSDIKKDLIVNRSAEAIKLYRKAFGFKDQVHDDREVLEIVEEDIMNFLKELKKSGRDKLPCRWASREASYSYTFLNVNPLEVKASDGGVVKVKYLTDLVLYARDWLDIATHMAKWSIERFRPGHVDQEGHEREMIHGDA